MSITSNDIIKCPVGESGPLPESNEPSGINPIKQTHHTTPAIMVRIPRSRSLFSSDCPNDSKEIPVLVSVINAKCIPIPNRRWATAPAQFDEGIPIFSDSDAPSGRYILTLGLSLAIMSASRYSPSNKIANVRTGNQGKKRMRIAFFSNIGQTIISRAPRKVNSTKLADMVRAMPIRLMKTTQA